MLITNQVPAFSETRSMNMAAPIKERQDTIDCYHFRLVAQFDKIQLEARLICGRGLEHGTQTGVIYCLKTEQQVIVRLVKRTYMRNRQKNYINRYIYRQIDRQTNNLIG